VGVRSEETSELCKKKSKVFYTGVSLLKYHMQEQQITAIILAATEMGGMGNDYFENKTRHLLPLADKPLIQHLIETVDKLEGVVKKYTIIIEEKVEENEKRYISRRKISGAHN
jgi:CTP:molybdopterin cytidylyltransferase MocA